MEGMIASYMNKILGQVLDTRRLNVGVPPDYVTRTLLTLKPFHAARNSFTVKEMETVTGMLIFIASCACAPWLKFLLSQVYTSAAAALGDNTTHLRRTNKQFRQFIKEAKSATSSEQVATFAQSESARQDHSCPRKHWINIRRCAKSFI
ncbi:hypothetical protein ACHAXR_002447 [Thalassiosira sp. AJA248-18]